MAAIVANTGSNNWNTNAAWVGGVQPTVADDVTIPASATITIPTATTVLCRSLTVAALGALTWAATTSQLNVGDATAGAGNVAVSISTTATITITSVGTLNFVSTSATQQTIDTGGKAMPNVSWNGANGSWKLASALSSGSNGSHTLTQGALDTGNFAMTGNRFICNSASTRSLTLGSSTLTYQANSAAVWNFAVTGLTFNAGTSNLQLTITASSVNMAALTYYDVTINVGAGAATLAVSAGISYRNLTLANTAVKTASLLISNNITVTGALLFSGNSASANRLLIASNAFAGTRTITANGTHGAHANVDFQDITIAGTAGTLTGTSLGDALGNSGITFDASTTQTWNGAAGSWSTGGRWTSRVPLPQDDVIVGAGFTGGGSLTCDMPRLGRTITLTGFVGTMGLGTAGTSYSIFGSLTLASGMTFNQNNGFSFMARSGTPTITSVGKSFSDITFSAPGATYTLQDDLSGPTTATLLMSLGGLDANGHNVTYGIVSSSTSSTRAITFGTGTWTLSGVGTILNFGTMTNLTLSAASSTIVVTDSSATTKTLSFGAATAVLNKVTAISGGTGLLIINNGLSLAELAIGPGQKVQLQSAKTVTFTGAGITGRGAAGNLATFTASTGASAATVSKLSGVMSLDYVSLQDIAVTGGVRAYAGVNSVNGGNNSGWIFAGAHQSDSFMAMA